MISMRKVVSVDQRQAARRCAVLQAGEIVPDCDEIHFFCPRTRSQFALILLCAARSHFALFLLNEHASFRAFFHTQRLDDLRQFAVFLCDQPAEISRRPESRRHRQAFARLARIPGWPQSCGSRLSRRAITASGVPFGTAMPAPRIGRDVDTLLARSGHVRKRRVSLIAR